MYRHTVASALAVLALVALPGSSASVPPHMTYQGHLTDAGGSPVDGEVTIQFTLYDAPSGGSALWTETIDSIPVANGLFDVVLGLTEALTHDVFDVGEPWLGLSVAGEPELVPRRRLASTGYSFRVGTVDGADAGTVQGGLIVNGVVTPNAGVTFPNGVVIVPVGNDVEITAGNSTITVSPAGGVTITAQSVAIQALNNLELSAGNSVSITAGATLRLSAPILDLDGAALVDVDGGLVQIN